MSAMSSRRERMHIYGAGGRTVIFQAACAGTRRDQPSQARQSVSRKETTPSPARRFLTIACRLFSTPNETEPNSYVDADGVIEDYDSMPTPSMLKKNLGLQQTRYIRYIGPSDELDTNLLALRPVDERQETRFPNGSSCRRVSRDTHFALISYSQTQVRAQEIQELDAIESIVRPHGKSLLNLYFRIIHPCFPILDKKSVIRT